MCDFHNNTLAAELKNSVAIFNFHSGQIVISYSYNLLVQDLSFL